MNPEMQDDQPLLKSVLPYWEKACAHLMAQEPLFQKLIRRFPQERLEGSGSAYQTLINSVVGQQISVKAALSIWMRLCALMPHCEPQEFLELTEEQLTAVGLSKNKKLSLKEISLAFAQGKINPDLWPQQEDKVILEDLSSLRGVGPWTAQMFLIFYLHRPNVLPLGDIGLLKGAAKFFSLTVDKMDPGELEQKAKKWEPYRTVGTWYLWRSLDPIPIVY